MTNREEILKISQEIVADIHSQEIRGPGQVKIQVLSLAKTLAAFRAEVWYRTAFVFGIGYLVAFVIGFVLGGLWPAR